MASPNSSIKLGLSKPNLLSLFIVCNFPIHVWAFFIYFQHLDWLLKADSGSASGVLSYFLAIALIESTGIFLFMAVIARIWQSSFSETQLLSFLSLAAWSICLGMIVVQFMDETNLNTLAIWGSVFFVIVFLIFFIFRLMKFQRFSSLAENFINRVKVLSTLFLILDVLAVLNIIVRNMT